MRGLWILAVLLSAMLAPFVSANGQDAGKSGQPIRFIVTFAPGGGVDIVARIIANRLSAATGQTVIVENRPGAAGVIGAKVVTSSEPNGKTVLVASNPLLINQVLRPEANFEILKELTPIASVAPQSIVIVASPDLPVTSLKEMLELSKKRDINFGTTGAGSLSHLAVEFLLSSQTGLRLQHVPFTGAAGALTAVMANQIEIGSSTVPPALPLLTSGKLKPLALGSAKRSALLPNVPTFAEAGFAPLPVSAWVGFFVPAKTPKAVADALSQSILAVANEPVAKQKFLEMGYEPDSIGSTEFAKSLEAELEIWTQVAAKAKLVITPQ